MQVAIIGIVNHDTIRMAGGEELQDLGGILYNAAVLANLMDVADTIHPISRIGQDCYDWLARLLAPYPNVDLSGIALALEGTSRNTIRYDAALEKVERLINRLAPISFSQIEPFLDSDALLINFIVGNDIDRYTMQTLRARAHGLVYLDVHNLCLGIDADGYRFHRTPEHWETWMGLADVVQMNEIETRLLAGRDMTGEDDFIDFGRRIVDLGPSVCIATRGRLGAITVYRTHEDGTEALVCPPEPVERVVDTTGCGDAFAAGFLAEYLISHDPVRATRLANWTAAFNCTLAGLSEVGRFREAKNRRAEISFTD